MREFGVPDDAPHVNPNGGAIAMGHPLGMSGARLILSASYQLKRSGGKYALCTMCVGVGQGVAVILELAKIMKKNSPPIGVSLVLFDAEDYGTSADSWSYAKGSQFFAQNIPINYPMYAINLDMIADREPEFYIERYLLRFQLLVDKCSSEYD